MSTHHRYQTWLDVSIYLIHYCVPRLSQTPASSTSDAGASIKWSSASVASSDSCCILDRCLRHNLEKKPWICMLDNHSVLSNILSPSIVQAVRISFATSLGLVSASVSSDIKFLFQVLPDVLRKPFTCTSLMKSPSHGKLWCTCQGFCGHCNQFSQTFTF